MALTGKQKAAMLLMSLDAVTATELLKGINPDLVQELAVELAYLDAAGYRSSKQSTQIARQFCNSLHPDEGFELESFLNEMLTGTVGNEKAEQIQTQIHDLVPESDPFARIRFLDSQTIASVLEKESPRTAAVVLSELPAKKSSAVLDHFGESIRLSAVRRMSTCVSMTREAKAQIAETVCKRLNVVATDSASEPLPTRIERYLIKMALILRNVGKKFRFGLFRKRKGDNDKAADGSMAVWEDIPRIADRLLHKALKGIDVKKLALALVDADYALVQKITSNISEPVASALNEQSSHLSDAEKGDVEKARGEIVRFLRERIN
ncbi:MAG: FliG C-terminal domain-containing protein [Planctomycetota bacterium]